MDNTGDSGEQIPAALGHDRISPIQNASAHAKRAVSLRSVGVAVSALVCVLIGVYAAWYSTAGRFTAFPAARNDYAALGDAFLHGQLSLREVPNPQLAVLPDPYDYNQRLNLAYHWDASYYRGRYYLYWGPVPALVSAGLQAVLGAPPSGALLVLTAYLALVVVLWALLIQISRGLFPTRSGLSIGPFVLLGLVNLL